MNKSLITNLIALSICLLSTILPVHNKAIFTIGMFALLGGMTNWLAVHMLFEKIPLMYGSGVIPNKFQEFKSAIKTLFLTEFFTEENITAVLSKSENNEKDKLFELINFNKLFDGLMEAIVKSKLSTMLAMIGGKEALEPLREPMINKLKDKLLEHSRSKDNSGQQDEIVKKLKESVGEIIDGRLDQLTPEQVKRIVEDMIKTQLGWLVIWGGIIGGGLGLILTIAENQIF
ncbi:MAG: DUF445 domain-containing protein [Betaproteobacteria bacterium TMED82]|nr:MAG: DUF445 domain-containing protein [Betaproteobacteria bacterium TMED82]|tara:strand:+ start:11280 stop:11972 length:693 start_codon:yes stop_codon:yes gene_type:complete